MGRGMVEGACKTAIGQRLKPTQDDFDRLLEKGTVAAADTPLLRPASPHAASETGRSCRGPHLFRGTAKRTAAAWPGSPSHRSASGSCDRRTPEPGGCRRIGLRVPIVHHVTSLNIRLFHQNSRQPGICRRNLRNRSTPGACGPRCPSARGTVAGRAPGDSRPCASTPPGRSPGARRPRRLAREMGIEPEGHRPAEPPLVPRQSIPQPEPSRRPRPRGGGSSRSNHRLEQVS